MNLHGLLAPRVLSPVRLPFRHARVALFSSGSVGLEPTTSGFGIRRSACLSYDPVHGVGRIRTDNLLGANQPLSQLELRPQSWPRQDSNLHAARATGFKPIASAHSATGPRMRTEGVEPPRVSPHSGLSRVRLPFRHVRAYLPRPWSHQRLESLSLSARGLTRSGTPARLRKKARRSEPPSLAGSFINSVRAG